MIAELIRAKITETKTHMTTKTGLKDIADAVEALEKVHICAVEFVNDWKKGDFRLDGLAKCDASSLYEACRDINDQKPKPYCANPQDGAPKTSKICHCAVRKPSHD